MFDILSHPHRRRVLVALGEDSPTDLDTLCETIATDAPGRDVRIQLVHSHLPKLDDLGYVEWDRESGAVERGPEWPTLHPLLGLLANDRDDLLGGRA